MYKCDKSEQTEDPHVKSHEKHRCHAVPNILIYHYSIILKPQNGPKKAGKIELSLQDDPLVYDSTSNTSEPGISLATEPVKNVAVLPTLVVLSNLKRSWSSDH